jgi:hypothetical protein
MSNIFKRHKIMGRDNLVEIEKKIGKERREEEMEKDLLEIYTDDKGVVSDLSEIKVKKKRPLALKILIYILLLTALSFSAYWAFSYFMNQDDSTFVLDVDITAPTKLVAGEEFFYEIEYENESKHSLKNIEINAKYPDNFVFTESYPEPSFNNNFFRFSDLGAGEGGKIKIRGRIINKEGVNNLMSVNAGYEVNGFSSFFKKDFYHSSTVKSQSFDLNLDMFLTILSGEEYNLEASFKDFNEFIGKDVAIYFSASDNIDFEQNLSDDLKEKGLELVEISKKVFKIVYNGEEELSDIVLDFKYKANDRIEDAELVTWGLRYLENDSSFDFYERSFTLDVIKSNLHLTTVVNSSDIDQTISFGETLDYVISYENKGDKEMVDLVIMTVLESDFLNWDSLSDDYGGSVSRNTISWSSQEIPNLKSLAPGDSGEIKFSIDVSEFEDILFAQDLEIKTFSQFSISNITEVESEDFKESDSKSNLINIEINSDFDASEKIMYFDENNTPVGSGPLPPAVGEESSFRVYWDMENSLHELRDLKAEFALPEYVTWSNNSKSSAGDINYDPVEHKISWSLDRLPIGINEVNVAFDISTIPTENELNKILILSTGSSFEARDLETNAIIRKNTGIKTTKLEDDSVANLSSDGRIK